jgi:4'-phosphopantetheinyl transferase
VRVPALLFKIMPLINIQIQYLNDVNWINGTDYGYAMDNNVDIWRVNITSNLSLLENFLTIIHPDEIARANRYFHVRDKNRFIISRGALRNILAKYLNIQPSGVEFEIGPNKKPHIKNAAGNKLYYNMSHSGDWILLAVANSEIGADTEFINDTYSYKDVLKDNFSADEINYINQGPSIDRFYQLWTRKEALTKATGKGLDEDLKLIPCLDGIHSVESNIISSTNNWLLTTFKLNKQYVASVASNPHAGLITFLDIYF